MPVNVDWMQAERDRLRWIIRENHRPLPNNPQGLMSRTVVRFGRSISRDRAEAVCNEVLSGLPDDSWMADSHYERIWESNRSNLVASPRRAHVESEQRDIELHPGSERPGDVQFSGLSPKFATEYGGQARWVNVLKMRSFGASQDVATVLPSELSPELLTEVRFGRAVLPSREGLVLPQDYKNHEQRLRLPSGLEAVTKWLRQQDILASPSDPGRVAERLLASLGGLRMSRLLAHKETLELLDKMARSIRTVSGDGTQETQEEVPDRVARSQEWRALIRRRNQLEPHGAVKLDHFVKAGALKLGLSVKCTTCGKLNWYGLSDLDVRVTCDRCVEDFDFPQGRTRSETPPVGVPGGWALRCSQLRSRRVRDHPRTPRLQQFVERRRSYVRDEVSIFSLQDYRRRLTSRCGIEGRAIRGSTMNRSS